MKLYGLFINKNELIIIAERWYQVK